MNNGRCHSCVPNYWVSSLANYNMETIGVGSLQGRKKIHKTRMEFIKRLKNLPTHRRDLNEQLDENIGVQRKILDVDIHTWMVTS